MCGPPTKVLSDCAYIRRPPQQVEVIAARHEYPPISPRIGPRRRTAPGAQSVPVYRNGVSTTGKSPWFSEQFVLWAPASAARLECPMNVWCFCSRVCFCFCFHFSYNGCPGSRSCFCTCNLLLLQPGHGNVRLYNGSLLCPAFRRPRS